MELTKLLRDIGYQVTPELDLILASTPIQVAGLTQDSRKVEKNMLFLAVKGVSLDGRNYIQSAIEAGACAILSEIDPSADKAVVVIKGVPIIPVVSLGQKLSLIGRQFYHPSHSNMAVIGITGTNGKTTTSQLVAMWMTLLGRRASVMGTLGNGLFGQLTPSDNTTPSALDIQENLANYEASQTELCAMEVSSHGLVQYRVESVKFTAVAFLNLSRDHLDYHGTMEAYEAAKWRLFSELPSDHQIINIDDPVGQKWYNRHPNATAVSLHASGHQDKLEQPYLFAKHIHFYEKGANIDFTSSFGNGCLQSQLLGDFNVTNLLVAMAILLNLGYDLTELCATAPLLKPIKGRMEVFAKSGHATAVVDYAHTPDALEKALIALSSHQTGQLWCVFGCGGDRDKGKRPLMAQVAETYADKIIVTDDNPRTEDREAITLDILQGFLGLHHKVIHDRTAAITYALSNAAPNDIVLIAGKGHEDYQIIGHTKYAYSDRDLVAALTHGGQLA